MHWDRRCAEGFRPPPSPPVRHAVSPVPAGTLPPQVVRALLKRGSHPWKVALSGRIPELSSTADDKNLLVGCSTDCSWCEKKAFCPSGGQGWLGTNPAPQHHLAPLRMLGGGERPRPCTEHLHLALARSEIPVSHRVLSTRPRGAFWLRPGVVLTPSRAACPFGRALPAPSPCLLLHKLAEQPTVTHPRAAG